jgi:leucyl-tRNA synthetase
VRIVEGASLDIDFTLPLITKDGVLIESDEYTGMPIAAAQKALGEWVESEGIGQRKIQYKLRDWLISRQRYWGCPIPVIHSKEGEMQLVPASDLPVELPLVEHYEPTGDGTSPLAHIPEFANVTDLDGRLGQRETDTMGGFACSSWYFLRFADPHNDKEAWSKEAADYWMPVDCYVGGAEHAVMHLLYARFWTKVLFDEGLVSVKEPFARLENQGQVLGLTPYRKPREGETLGVGEEGILVSYDEAAKLPESELTWRWARMSKSKGNVVTPEEAVEQYGADALRMYLLFVAPFNADVNWANEGMAGQVRFLSRIFKLVEELQSVYVPEWKDLIPFEEMSDTARKIRRLTHQTIQRCTDDIERFAFNTYVSWLMKFVNGISDISDRSDRSVHLAFSEAVDSLVLLLAPGAPHSADELWESLGKIGFTLNATWPSFDPTLAEEETDTIAVQVNGKLRDTFEAPSAATKEELEAMALRRPKVQAYLEGLTIRKVIVVPHKLVNIVAN